MVFVKGLGPIPSLDFAMPDVCLTPVGPAVAPIPYPNFALGPVAPPAQLTVLNMAMPGHNLLATHVTTLGDNVGVSMGVASGLVMGPSRQVSCSTNLIYGVAPVTKMLNSSMQNSTNMVGMCLSPAQIKVINLR
jgi:hypothetical protein